MSDSLDTIVSCLSQLLVPVRVQVDREQDTIPQVRDRVLFQVTEDQVDL